MVKNLLTSSEVDAVYRVVKDFTEDKAPPRPVDNFSSLVIRINEILSKNFYIVIFVLFIIVVLNIYVQSNILAFASLATYSLSLLLIILVMLTFIFLAIPIVYKVYKNPYTFIFSELKFSFNFDKKYIARLKNCSKNSIRYVLTIYRYERNGLEKRGGVLSGSIDKIGLFPALGVLALLSVGLSKAGEDYAWIQIIVPVIMAFHFMNLSTFTMLQKMDRVISILEYTLASDD